MNTFLRRILLLVGVLLASTAGSTLFGSSANAQSFDDVSCTHHTIVQAPHFVWGLSADDPDGGLVARTGPSVEYQRIEVLAFDSAQVFPTGGCAISSTGSTWYEIHGSFGPEWVSGNLLQPAQSACLTDSWRSGHAVGRRGDIAFAPHGSNRYAFYPKATVVVGHPCPPRFPHAPRAVPVPIFQSPATTPVPSFLPAPFPAAHYGLVICG